MTDVAIEYRRRGTVVFALPRFDLEVGEGELIHVRGPSGSGKSSILRVLAGLQPPQRGEVIVMGVPIYQRNAGERALLRGSSIGFVFQSVHLLPMFDALTNVMIPRLIAGGSRRSAERDARALLERFGVAHRERHRPHELSGGEQRRVGLARAVINDPPLVIADEPFADVDRDNAMTIWDAMAGWVANGRTVIISSHVDLPDQRSARVVDLDVDGVR